MILKKGAEFIALIKAIESEKDWTKSQYLALALRLKWRWNIRLYSIVWGNGLWLVNKRESSISKPTHKVDYIKEHIKGAEFKGSLLHSGICWLATQMVKARSIQRPSPPITLWSRPYDSVPAKAKLNTWFTDENFWIEWYFTLWKSEAIHLRDGTALVEEGKAKLVQWLKLRNIFFKAVEEAPSSHS